jgi:hypothetical protein
VIRALSFETGGKVLLRGFTNTIQDIDVKVIDDANMVLAAIDADGQLLVSLSLHTHTHTQTHRHT